MRTAEQIANKVWGHHGLCREETMFDDGWTWNEFVAWLKGNLESRICDRQLELETDDGHMEESGLTYDEFALLVDDGEDEIGERILNEKSK